jgi:hypothetical protein
MILQLKVETAGPPLRLARAVQRAGACRSPRSTRKFRRHPVETVLIDQFVVPEASVEEFLTNVHLSARIVRTRPGFVEGYVFRRAAGEGRVNIVTTAVWATQEALEQARKSVPSEFEKIGFDPAAIIKRLGVEAERGIFQRAPY